MKSLWKPLPNLNDLSLEEQVAQMVVIRASGYLFDHQIQYPAWEPSARQLQYYLQELNVGGVILLGGSAGELALRSQQLQNWANIPLLIAADIEEGVGQRFGGATWFPPPMAIGAVSLKNFDKAQLYAEQMGAITAQEALAIGINWVLAPVVDVNNNPLNPVINVRAFGETPETVGKLASAFIRGAQRYPVLTTAKHFPGHGDTAVDSHMELPVLPHTPPRLAQIELPPFMEAIAAGVDAVMSAHLLIPAWDEHRPATLSARVLTELLRECLTFEGLIVTDALIMGAITNRYGSTEAPVMAVEAGADILLMPVNPETAIQAVCDAVEAGRISRERIRASVERIWKAKQKVSQTLQRSHELVNLESPSQYLEEVDEHKSYTPQNIFYQLAQPATLNTVTNILQESQQVGGSLPLSLEPNENIHRLRNLIVIDDALACDSLGRNTPAVTLPRQMGYELQLVDRYTPKAWEDVNHGFATQPTLLQLFIRGNPFRGSAGLTPVAEGWFKRLLRTGDLQALVIYGSPYVLQQFLPDLPRNTPFVFSYGQMPQAQAIALETLFSSSLPVNTSTLFL
ncbi:MAG TPA: glycoside hydrolase family 3 N-terminal domain-containing protein [Candidatus Sericytochromatia bacterium]